MLPYSACLVYKTGKYNRKSGRKNPAGLMCYKLPFCESVRYQLLRNSLFNAHARIFLRAENSSGLKIVHKDSDQNAGKSTLR